MTQPADTPRFSVVVPVFNSEKSLDELYDRIRRVFEDTLSESFELVLVDDNSRDDSLDRMRRLRAADPRVKVIHHIRNYGQQTALMTGFKRAAGEWIVTMDDDLQNPPEELPKLLAKFDEGYEVVIGVPRDKKHSAARNVATRWMNFLHKKILGKPDHLRFAAYRVFTRGAVDRIKNARSGYHYITAYILKKVALNRIANVTVEHHPRVHGRSNYNLGKMLRLASNLLINHSAIPLRTGIYVGFGISLACVGFALYVFVRALLHGYGVAGWATTTVLISFLLGMVFLFLGIIGEYIYRLLNDVSGDDQAIVQEIE